ncbi:MAG: hypothetical protein RL557_1067 [archaeon]
MYNANFLPQLREFRGDLWGADCVDTRAAAEEASRRRYVPPEDVKLLPCYEDINGDWVPHIVEHVLGKLEKSLI